VWIRTTNQATSHLDGCQVGQLVLNPSQQYGFELLGILLARRDANKAPKLGARSDVARVHGAKQIMNQKDGVWAWVEHVDGVTSTTRDMTISRNPWGRRTTNNQSRDMQYKNTTLDSLDLGNKLAKTLGDRQLLHHRIRVAALARVAQTPKLARRGSTRFEFGSGGGSGRNRIHASCSQVCIVKVWLTAALVLAGCKGSSGRGGEDGRGGGSGGDSRFSTFKHGWGSSCNITRYICLGVGGIVSCSPNGGSSRGRKEGQVDSLEGENHAHELRLQAIDGGWPI
jgi:hypothetical protein